jgi:hypothetical protein
LRCPPHRCAEDEVPALDKVEAVRTDGRHNQSEAEDTALFGEAEDFAKQTAGIKSSAPLRLCRVPGLRPPRSGAEDTATRTSFLSKKGGGRSHLRPSAHPSIRPSVREAVKWRSGEVEKRKSGEAEKWTGRPLLCLDEVICYAKADGVICVHQRSGEAEKWRSGVVDWTSASLPGRSHLLRKGRWCHLRPSVHPSIRPRRGEVEKR